MAQRPLSRLIALRLATAAMAAAPLRASAQNNSPLRVGGESGVETFAELQYGVDAGLFTRAGLDVVVSSFPTAGPIAAALAGGALDIGTVDLILLANAVNRGVPLVALAASGLFRSKEPTGGLCVSKSSPIRNAKGFEGSTIAVATLVSLTSLSLQMWLAKNGADPAKVRFVEMKFAEMPAAIQRGTVAGAYIGEPIITENAETLKLIATPYAVIAETFPISVIITTRAWLAQNRDLARRFVAVVYDTARWVNRSRAQTAVMLAKYTHLDLDIIRRMRRTQFATALDQAQIQAVLDAAAANKLLDRPTNAAELIARL